ncbi:hypothetical protein UFOVP2_6 [uncultured Caudovirales phage]|uniref:Uncharacterized protein n=1 Tax=uncultured Caudovirales phage TaxID=2100421 RepID=A0A6J5KFV9_9CAUD|nr:hypothetical protein UFOVP2_6 [uncultured Caudovirales phage]
MATKAKTEVATQDAFPLGTALPSYMNQGAARGSEEVKSTDMVLPRLEIVQALSPIKETDENAREGYLFNSVTQEIIGDLAYFVPVYFRLEYLIWKAQNEGGGFFGSFDTLADAEARKAEVISDGENPEFIEIVDTPVQYGLRITPDGATCEQIVISMAKTKSKVSRKWNAMIQIAGGDRFSRVYKISSFTDENKKGQKFKNFVVQPAGFTPEKVYHQAEALYHILKTQDFRVAHETVAEADGSTTERGGI